MPLGDVQEKRATLADVINYKGEDYINEADVSLIRTAFKGQPKLLEALRKVFLPSIGDRQLPVEELGKDPWLSIDFRQIPEENIKTIVLARQDAIKFVMNGLIQLKIIANTKEETAQDKALRIDKDSLK